MSTKPERLARNTIYQNRWVNLHVDRVRFPNGSTIEKHHLLDFDHQAVMAIPRDQDGRYLMVKVSRYPTGSIEWEFPAGSIEEGEEILAAGAREVLEETGYQTTNHQLLYTFHPMHGIANKVFQVIRCQVLTGQPAPFDANEISAVKWFSKDEIWQMIQTKLMEDGYTLTAFLLDQHL